MTKKLIVIVVGMMLTLITLIGITSAENLEQTEESNINEGVIDEHTTAIVATIDPGVPISWNELLKKNVDKPSKISRDIPMRYDIDKDKMDKLKKERYVKPNKELATITEDTSEYTYASPLAPALIKNFEGPSIRDSRPPDPNIAAGPNHVGVVVNTEVAFYTKAGVLVGGVVDLEDLFSNVCSGCFPFDPRIVYDKKEGHWIIIALEANDATQESWYLISVSKTSDPSGIWTNWKIVGNLNYGGIDTWADYEDIGFDSILSTNGGAVYVTSNQFGWANPWPFKTSTLNIIPKSALYTGSVPGSFWRVSGMTNVDGSLAFTLRAAQTLDSTNGEFLVNTKNNWDKVTLWKAIPTYPPTPLNLVRRATMTIGKYFVPPDAKQLGCTNTLDTIDNRLYNAVYFNKKLYTAFTEKNDWGTPANTEASIRYLKINTTSNTVMINKKYGKDNMYYWFPAITADKKGNITFVFARGGSTQYAGIHYTGQKITEPNTEPSALLKAGEQCITGQRWGDYFGISNDPVNDRFVWIYGEWAKNAGIDPIWNWGTWIGKTRH